MACSWHLLQVWLWYYFKIDIIFKHDFAAFTIFQILLLINAKYVTLRLVINFINQFCMFVSYLLVVFTWYVKFILNCCIRFISIVFETYLITLCSEFTLYCRAIVYLRAQSIYEKWIKTCNRVFLVIIIIVSATVIGLGMSDSQNTSQFALLISTTLIK